MTGLQELLQRYYADSLGLAELLVSIEQRGPVAPDVFARDLQILHNALLAGSLPLPLQRAIDAKLRQVQGVNAQDSQDLTEDPPTLVTHRDELPGVRHRATPDEATVTRAKAQPAAADEPTVMRDDAALAATPDGPGLTEAEEEELTRIMGDAQGDATRINFDLVLDETGGGDTDRSGADGKEPAADASTSASRSRSSWTKVSEMDSPEASVGPGHLLKNRFLLEHEIGRGGMGIVYRAIDKLKEEAQDRNPHIAIKVLNDEFRKHPDALKALQREARKSQMLNHDHIVRVYDFDRDGATIYMTMEYVDGRPLNELIRDPEFHGMSLKEAAPIIEGIGSALIRAHRAGIVHSDFKPGNVLLRRDGVAKVFDFGIARAATAGEHGHGETTVFDAGTLGALTPAYASLEMLQGDEPDPRDDLYALAIVVYELLTGSHPFRKKNAQRALDDGMEPVRVPGLRRGAWKTLRQGMAIHRDDRLESVDQLLDGLLRRGAAWRGYRFPGIAAGVTLAAAAVLYVPVSSLLERREANAFIDQLVAGRIPDRTAVRPAFDALDPVARQRVVAERREEVIDHFRTRRDEAWDPSSGQYDFRSSRAALEQLSCMIPETVAEVLADLQSLEAQKNSLLSDLNDRFEQALEAASIYPEQSDSAAAVLAIVEQIEPEHPLLSDQRLMLAYANDIRDELDADNVDRAGQKLAAARARFPQAERLANLSSELDDRVAARTAQQRAAELARLEAEQRTQRIAAFKAEFDTLLARSPGTAQWNVSIQRGLEQARELLGSDDPWLAQARTRAADAYLGAARARMESDDLAGALIVAGLGLELAPQNADLRAQRRSILREQQRREAEAATRTERVEVVQSRLDRLLASTQASATLPSDIADAFQDARKLVGARSDWIRERETMATGLYLRLSRSALGLGDLDRAEALLAHGYRYSPDSAELRQQRAAIEEARVLARAEAERDAQRLRAQARQELLAQLAEPKFTPVWERELAASLAAVPPDDPQLAALRSEIARAYRDRAEGLRRSNRHDEAISVIDRGLALVNDSNNLRTAREEIELARVAFEQEQEALARQARIDGLKSSLRTQARANDSLRAARSLAQLREALGASDAWLRDEAEPLVLAVFSADARAKAGRGAYASALEILDSGSKLLGGPAELRELRREYSVPAAEQRLLAAVETGESLDDRRLRDARELLSRSEPGRWKTILPRLEAGIEARLIAHAAQSKEQARAYLTAAQALLPQSTRLAALKVPSGNRPLVDPCKAEFAGYGRKSRASCYDNLGADERSPRLVVVPGLAGKAPFAMSKYEVSVRDYNLYCTATGACKARGGLDLLPVSGLSLAQIQAYVAWLSDRSGYEYRLPTEAEWEHAARASGAGPGGDFNCLLRQGASTIKGDAPIKINVGEAGGWGLLNMVGNVQEVVDAGGRPVLRGGGFRDPMSSCAPDLRRDFNGRADETVGFRLVRPLG